MRCSNRRSGVPGLAARRICCVIRATGSRSHLDSEPFFLGLMCRLIARFLTSRLDSFSFLPPTYTFSTLPPHALVLRSTEYRDETSHLLGIFPRGLVPPQPPQAESQPGLAHLLLAPLSSRPSGFRRCQMSVPERTTFDSFLFCLFYFGLFKYPVLTSLGLFDPSLPSLLVAPCLLRYLTQ